MIKDMEKRAGFDVNSFIREYARKVLNAELPIPDEDMNVVPFGELIITINDFEKMNLANSAGFRNSKEAN